ncbi:MAG: hypothetical protein WBQ73_04085, partial [Candidatus Babeliales bacterium]
CMGLVLLRLSILYIKDIKESSKVRKRKSFLFYKDYSMVKLMKMRVSLILFCCIGMITGIIKGSPQENVLNVDLGQVQAICEKLNSGAGTLPSTFNLFIVPNMNQEGGANQKIRSVVAQKGESSVGMEQHLKELCQKFPYDTCRSWLSCVVSKTGVLLIGSLLGGVCIGHILYKITTGNRYLQSQKLWSSWNSGELLPEGMTYSTQETAERFIKELCCCYMNVSPLVNIYDACHFFLKESLTEYQILVDYENFYTRMNSFGIRFLLPFDTKVWETLPERKERLLYYRSVVQDWMISSMIEHARYPHLLIRRKGETDAKKESCVLSA